MTLLFIARHFTYFRNYESVVAELAARGHRIHLAADREEAMGGRDLVDRLAARFPAQVSVEFTPILQWGRYRRLTAALRLGLDYLRYSEERYAGTPRFRERARIRTPLAVLWLARLPWRRAVVRMLEGLERVVPRQLGIDDFIRARTPDVLLITPLVELGSPQLDYLRAARELGVPTALGVWSWDHLSSKALIRVVPDRLLVWNGTQRDEAKQFHDVPAERVMVTGAQCFDQWFDREPSRDRETFLAEMGLPAGQPYLLYVCSALLRGSQPEAPFVLRWIAAIRQSSDPHLRAVPILVRPHPQRLDEWDAPEVKAGVAGLPGVAFRSRNPVDAGSRADYFDAMYHAAAVIGLNTSAMVESAIVDRPVYAPLLPEFFENQEGTFHFHYLMRESDGFLNVARTMEAHVAQLADGLAGAPARGNRRFVEHFIRPNGMGVSATSVVADAVESLAGLTVVPARPSLWRFLVRPLVWAIVLADRIPVVERLYWNPGKLAAWRQNVEAMAGKQEYLQAKRQEKTARILRKLPRQAVAHLKTGARAAARLITRA